MIRTHTPTGLAACHPHSAFSSHTLCLACAKAHTQRHLVAQCTSGHVCSQLPVTTFAGAWSPASFLQGSGMTVLSGSHTRWTLSSPCLQTPSSPVRQHHSAPSRSFLLTSGLVCPSLSINLNSPYFRPYSSSPTLSTFCSSPSEQSGSPPTPFIIPRRQLLLF